MTFRRILQAALCVQVFLAWPAMAVRIGTGTLSIDVIGSPTDFTACALVTFDNVPFNVFGTDVNLATQVQTLFCSGQTIAGVAQPVHCTSGIGGAFDFDQTADVICTPANCLGSASFVSTSIYNVTGSTPAALGSLSYTSDGSVDFVMYTPSPTLAGCPAVGGGPHYEGTFGMNAFQPVATPSGTDVEVSNTLSFFNPISSQMVSVAVDVMFASVGTPGETLVTATSNASGSLSSNFVTAIGGYQAAFLDISTTANVAPPITICFKYPDANNDGVIDGTSVSEGSLRLLHGEGSPVAFVDRTVSQDTVGNEVCAEVNSLSPFVTAVNLCGNSAVDSGETCDDGNPGGGDGCSATCHTEPGWQCSTPGSACTFVCGNSTVNSSETCDDGDSDAGDGCSASCQVEPGWQCPTPGSPCTFVCGNGTIDSGEQCDDGDASAGDGCSDHCQIEVCYTCTGAPSTCTAQTAVACSDGDPCTTSDTCQSGACVGTTVTCQPLGPCYDAGTCNPLSGVCSNPLKGNGAACSDGDGCPADTCLDGQCQAVSCPLVDAVVLNRPPLNVSIGSSATSVAKTLAITVRNADSVDRTIELTVDALDCPIGLAGSPDFDASTPAPDTSVLVKAGKTKKAKVPLVFLPADYASFNFKAPARCTLHLNAAAVVAGGSNDPTPANNTDVVEINVVDKHDSEQSSVHETTVKSASAKTLNIGKAKSSGSVALKAVVGNADYRPSPESGDTISLSASTTCTGMALSEPICDPSTSSDTVTVKGGATKTCKLTATAFSGPIATANKLSPQRCTVTLTAHGPSDPEMSPLEPSNNSTELTIDVFDKNDQ